MKHWIELPVFATLAILLHVVLFASAPNSGSEAGGSGGEALMSIEAASATVVEMVESWDRPPEIQTEAQTPITTPDPVPSKAPALPRLELAEAPRAQMRVAVMQPAAPETSEVDTTPPSPPKPVVQERQANLPKTHPKSRPKRPEPQVKKAEKASSGRAAQQAAGSGGTAQAGQGTAKTATASKGQTAELRAVWGARIRARIERNKRYPRGTRVAGNVALELSVTRDGKLLNYRIKRSSGHAALDKAAMGAVARAKRFPKAPADLPGNSFHFSLTMKLVPR